MTLRDAVLIVHYKINCTKARTKHLHSKRNSKYKHPFVDMCCEAAINDAPKWRELLKLVLDSDGNKSDNRAAN